MGRDQELCKTRLTRDYLYPISGTFEEGAARRRLKVASNHVLRAKWDGKPKRAPKKGEWFLSGAVIEAYVATSDMATEYHIAVLVEAEVAARYVVVREIPKGE